MIKKGAALTGPEGAQVAGYLAAKSTFEAKCNTCHDLDRPLTAIKSPEQWKATVLKMSAKKPGVITDEEAGGDHALPLARDPRQEIGGPARFLTWLKAPFAPGPYPSRTTDNNEGRRAPP